MSVGAARTEKKDNSNKGKINARCDLTLRKGLKCTYGQEKPGISIFSTSDEN
jgi:hypothetical protein